MLVFRETEIQTPRVGYLETGFERRAMATDIRIYCDCMARIRDRINVMDKIMALSI